MEQIQHFVNWYLGLYSDPDNKVKIAAWGVTITTATFIIVYVVKPLRKFVLGLFSSNTVVEPTEENPVPSIDLFINQDDTLQPMIDDTFNSKLTLAKQRFRLGQAYGIRVELTPTFQTANYDEFRLQTLRLHLEEIRVEIQKNVEILLKINDYHLANAHNLQTAFNSLLEDPPFNVTGKTKLDIYRTHDPMIDFPVYLSDEQIQSIATDRNTTVELLIQDLRMPQLLTTSIFPDEILCTDVVPALVREIYRRHSRHNFNFDTTPHWWNIGAYEVGLG
jgi:hypothetical protein